MHSRIQKFGHSLGLFLEKKLLLQAGINANTPINMFAEEGAIVIKPLRKRKSILKEISTRRRQFKKDSQPHKKLKITKIIFLKTANEK